MDTDVIQVVAPAFAPLCLVLNHDLVSPVLNHDLVSPVLNHDLVAPVLNHPIVTQKHRVCSWDVGIKNLAFCIIERTTGTTDFTIIKWAIIDIVDSNLVTCAGTIHKKPKKGESKDNQPLLICGKKAAYVGTSEDLQTTYFCGTHKKQFKPLEDNWLSQYVTDLDKPGKCTIKNAKTDKPCDKKALSVIGGDHVCNIHKKALVNKKQKDSQVCKIKRGKVTDTDTQVLATNMFTKLDAIPELLQVNEVLIENQPGLTNPTMKTVSTLLFSYFSMRGLVDRKNNSILTKVRFICPSNKLKISGDPVTRILDDITVDTVVHKQFLKILDKVLPAALPDSDPDSDPVIDDDKLVMTKLYIKQFIDIQTTYDDIKDDQIWTKTKVDPTFLKKIGKTTKDSTDDKKKTEVSQKKVVYEITKELSLMYTDILLENKKGTLDILSNYKKKDDMCDAFIQGYHYVFKKQ